MPPDRSESARESAVEAGPADHAATIARLFREHNSVLIGFLAARLQNEHEAQEVAQEAYVKLLQLDRSNAVSFLRAYLFRVAENLALDRLKHRNHVTRHYRLESLAESFGGHSVEDEAAASQELDLFSRFLAELPSRCQEAFRKHRLEERPVQQIATEMGITDRMVRKYIARALIYTRLRLDGLRPEEVRQRLKL